MTDAPRSLEDAYARVLERHRAIVDALGNASIDIDPATAHALVMLGTQIAVSLFPDNKQACIELVSEASAHGYASQSERPERKS